MNDENIAEISKKFSENLVAIRQKLSEFDEKIINPHELVTDKVFLNEYGRLIEQICATFNAETLNIFFQQTADPLLLDGVLTIRTEKSTRLQFIKTPIDNLTIAGYTFLKSKNVNIANLYTAEEKYHDLEPNRNKEIDRRLNQITKECLSAPIISPINRKLIGAIVFANNTAGRRFAEIYEKGVNALAILIAKSYNAGGVFARVIDSTKSIGRGGFATSLAPNVIDIDSGLSAEDFVGTKTQNTEKINLNLNTSPPKAVSENNVSSASTVAQNKTPAIVRQEKIEPDVEEEYEEDEEEIIAQSPKPNNVSQPSIATFERKSLDFYIKLVPIPDVSKLPQLKTKYDYLVATRKISDKELVEAVEISTKKETSVEDYLRRIKKVSVEDIGASLAAFYKYDYVPFSQNYSRPAELLARIKQSFLEEHKWLPLNVAQGSSFTTYVVTPDPLHSEVYGSISQLLSGRKIQLVVTTEFEFNQFFNSFFKEADIVQDMISEIGNSDLELKEDLESTVDAATSDDEIVKLVNKIIYDAYNRRCSDIHIEPYPGNLKTRVRFRIDGELVEYVKMSPQIRPRVVNRIKIMANMNISENRMPQDGKIKMIKFMRTLDIELRVATYPVAGGFGNQNFEDVVMRILSAGEPIPLEKLGFNPVQEKRLLEIADKPYGIIFVCGPTGSGKTTTLHSVLKYLNKDGTKIVTAEDPVEIMQNGLRQIQINRQSGLTFELAMRSFLRADPDVIMVGEMRDHETVSAGVEASLTGHLVLSTLHTNSAPEAITRLLDMGMDPLNFADAMLGIVAQRLAKKLCQNCREVYYPDEEELKEILSDYFSELGKTEYFIKNHELAKNKAIELLIKEYGVNGKLALYRAKSCDLCVGGYRGRVGLYELLVGSERIKTAIKKRNLVEDILKIAIEDGMFTLRMDGIHKCFQGMTDIKQVKLVCMK